MKYYISSTSFNVDKNFIEEFKKQTITFLKKNFVFDKNEEFDNFILIPFYIPIQMREDFGKDHIKLSKKERSIFLGVVYENELLLQSGRTYDENLKYQLDRILEVKEQFLNKLKKAGIK